MKQAMLLFAAVIGLLLVPQVARGAPGVPPVNHAQKLPQGDYDVWENGEDTGNNCVSLNNGDEISTEDPAWFGQWVESQKHYDQHPGNEKVEIYPTANSDIFEWKKKDGSGTIIGSGTLKKL